MAAGCLQGETAFKTYPSGGWGTQWVGESDRGYGKGQPGGWHFQILPYIDQVDLYNLDKGQVQAGATQTSNPTRMNLAMQQAQTPVAIFLCPTRHGRLQAFPYVYESWCPYVNMATPVGVIGRSDYAGCEGSTYETNDPKDPNPGYDPKFDWSSMEGTVNGSPPATGVIYRAGLHDGHDQRRHLQYLPDR